MTPRKQNHAERYMEGVAVRNEIIRILTEWFGGRDGETVIQAAADEILAIDPKAAMREMMRGAS